jgi:hypothetical protein
MGKPERHIDLDVYRIRLDSKDGGTAQASEHVTLLVQEANRLGVASNQAVFPGPPLKTMKFLTSIEGEKIAGNDSGLSDRTV